MTERRTAFDRWAIPLALTALLVAGACRIGPELPAGPADVVSPVDPADVVSMPNAPDSLKFAVLGDFGTGERSQYEMGEQMARTHEVFPFELVVLVGDNLYGSERPQDFERKFERPYQALLSRGVKFYASLGNHDSREQRFYEHFNMDGELYYTFKAPRQDVRFFALESTYMDPDQVAWIQKELQGAGEDWKIAFFHHPLYSSGERHGSDLRLREVLEPLFVNFNVSVVFTGHDHFYERIKPQQGIPYFVAGSGGKLRPGNIAADTTISARGYDRDLTFVVAEVAGDELTFQAITRLGVVVDSGIIMRRQPPDEDEGPE
jgi:hypothetical protein